MRARQTKRTILVPILGDDITETALTTARSLLANRGNRLVLLHVERAADLHCRGFDVPKTPTTNRRWQCLASAAPERTFIDAEVGNAADVVRSEARRFGSDTIVVGGPSPLSMPHPRRTRNRTPSHREGSC